MGKPSEPEIERNKALFNDYLLINPDGTKVFSFVDLVTKYKISPQRIQQIVNREKRKEKENGTR